MGYTWFCIINHYFSNVCIIHIHNQDLMCKVQWLITKLRPIRYSLMWRFIQTNIIDFLARKFSTSRKTRYGSLSRTLWTGLHGVGPGDVMSTVKCGISSFVVRHAAPILAHLSKIDFTPLATTRRTRNWPALHSWTLQQTYRLVERNSLPFTLRRL